jgi:uncharacterized repeat protein (TIGR02543 family)
MQALYRLAPLFLLAILSLIPLEHLAAEAVVYESFGNAAGTNTASGGTSATTAGAAATGTGLGGKAAVVDNAVMPRLAVDFADASTKSLSYGTAIFSEAAANNGTISTSATVTLRGDTFTGTNNDEFVSGKVTASNVPSGLAASVKRASANTVTVTLTGTASSHAGTNSINNLKLQFADGAFTGGSASSVTNYAKSDLLVIFTDGSSSATPTVYEGFNYTAGTNTAAAAPGSATTTGLTVTVTGLTGSWVMNKGASTNVSGTSIEADGFSFGTMPVLGRHLKWTGNASNNASNNFLSADLTTSAKSDLAPAASAKTIWMSYLINTDTFAYGMGVYLVNSTASGDTTGNQVFGLGINSASPRAFVVMKGNQYTGSAPVAGGKTAWLVGKMTYTGATNPTFTSATMWVLDASTGNPPTSEAALGTPAVAWNGSLTSSGDYAPAKLMLKSATNSGYNPEFDEIRVGTSYAAVAPVSVTPSKALTYSGTTFSEATANDGAISSPITATLSGDTFTGSVGDEFVGSKVTVANVPVGLTASVKKASDTTATVTLTGNASNHATANDVANLTIAFQDSAFTTAGTWTMNRGGSSSNVNGSSFGASGLSFGTLTAAGQSLAWNGTQTSATTNALASDLSSTAKTELAPGGDEKTVWMSYLVKSNGFASGMGAYLANAAAQGDTTGGKIFGLGINSTSQAFVAYNGTTTTGSFTAAADTTYWLVGKMTYKKVQTTTTVTAASLWVVGSGNPPAREGSLGTATATFSGTSTATSDMDPAKLLFLSGSDSNDPQFDEVRVGLTYAAVAPSSGVTNSAPTVANAIADQTMEVLFPFYFQVPDTTFSDSDSDTLTYTATKEDGSPLPSWLSFIPATRYFSGAPTLSDIGTINVKVTAADGFGGTVSDTFAITVNQGSQKFAKGTSFNVMFAGDSITEGKDPEWPSSLDKLQYGPGWRAILTDKMEANGYTFTPVGISDGSAGSNNTSQTKLTTDDGNNYYRIKDAYKWHAGVGGKGLTNWISYYQNPTTSSPAYQALSGTPDLVMISLGTNDIASAEQSSAGYLQNASYDASTREGRWYLLLKDHWGTIFTYLKSQNANMVVLVFEVPDKRSTANDADRILFNRQLAKVIPELAASKGIDARVMSNRVGIDKLSDGTHLNHVAGGQDLMAQHYYDAFLSIAGSDIQKPTWAADYPKADTVTNNGCTVRAKTDEAGKAYYVIVANGDPAPSAAQVKAGKNNAGNAAFASGSITLTANTEASATATGLAPGNNYDVYVVAEDAATTPNLQTTPVQKDITTLTTADTTAPSWVSGYPLADTATAAGFTVRTKIDEAGTAYFVVVADGATAPTVDQVKAGATYGSVTVLKSGSWTLAANTESSTALSGLTANTAYDVYFVAQDAASPANVQSAVVKKDVTTLAGTMELIAYEPFNYTDASTANDPDGGVNSGNGLPANNVGGSPSGTSTGLFGTSSGKYGAEQKTVAAVTYSDTNGSLTVSGKANQVTNATWSTGGGEVYKSMTTDPWTAYRVGGNNTGYFGVDGKTLYASVLVRTTNTWASGNVARGYISTSSSNLYFGVNANTSSNKVGISWNLGTNKDSTTTAAANSTYLMVFRFVYTGSDTTIDFWVNPPLSNTLPSTSDGQIVLTGTSAALKGWGTRTGTADVLILDEFRIGTTIPAVLPYTPTTSYSVTYDGNGSGGGSVPTDSNTYGNGSTVTVLGNTGGLTKAGYTFAGWNTASNGTGTTYAAGTGSFSMGSANVTLYAMWTANGYRVTYDGNGKDGGSAPIDAISYANGATVTAAANSGSLTKTGSTFAGWNTASDGSGTNYAAGSGTFTMGSSNVTLYAKWTSAIETWRNDYFGQTANTGDAADDADPDGDGIVNLLEYALGSEPDSSASRPDLASQISDLKLQITFTPQGSGITYTIEASSDLSDWSETTDLTSLTVGTPYTHTDSTALGGTTTKRFLRLKVSQP